MTRSIFDPTGPNTERSGSTFLGPDADNRSQMPESAVDGVVDSEVAPENDIIDVDPDQLPAGGPASEQRPPSSSSVE